MDENFGNGGQGFDNGQGFESQGYSNSGSDLGSQGSDFSVPEEYKDKGWAKFFDGKTGDELKSEFFRSYDNSQTLIGKKVEDYLKTTDLKSLDNYEEIKEVLTKQIAPQFQVPENAEGYDFNDILKNEDGSLQYEYPKDALGYFGEKFKELGISKEQGQGLLKTYTQFEIGEFQKYTNADELENSINTMFAGNQGQRKTAEGLLKEFLPQQDRDFLQKTAPNYTIEMFYKVAKGLADKYGYKEGSVNSTNTSQFRMSEADRNAEYERLVNKMEELENRPHTDAEMAQYQKALRKLFNA